MDRNAEVKGSMVTQSRSLSARRAWIEIYLFGGAQKNGRVALRKESVDRNEEVRRLPWQSLVALRKESVDRNTTRGIGRQHVIGRSPQGERG